MKRVCEICGKVCKNRQGLKNHERIHSREERLPPTLEEVSSPREEEALMVSPTTLPENQVSFQWWMMIDWLMMDKTGSWVADKLKQS